MESKSYGDIASLRGGETLYIKGRAFSATMYVGSDRVDAPILGSCGIKFKRGYDAGFDATVESAVGSAVVDCKRVREGLYRWMCGCRYEGPLLVDATLTGSVEAWSSATSELFCSVTFGDDHVVAHRVDPGCDTAVRIAAKSIGEIARVDYGGPEMSIRELCKSRFGFGRIPFGTWTCDGKALCECGDTLVHAVLLALFLPRFIADFSSTTGGAS